MFENSLDSVQFHTIGEPIIDNCHELFRMQHFDSEFEGLLRKLSMKTKHRDSLQQQIKRKMQSNIDGCLQILSYQFEQTKTCCQLSICLAPTVKQTLFARLKKQIQGNHYSSEVQLKNYLTSLIETVSGIEQYGEYRDINLWNVFEDEHLRLFVGELSEVQSTAPVSSMYGCFVDYISPQRRCFQSINRPLEMAWGVGMILLAFATNQLPRSLNLKGSDIRNKLEILMETAKQRYGWGLYELISALLEPAQKRISCSRLKLTQQYKSYTNADHKRSMTLRFQSLAGAQIPQQCQELTIYQCENIEKCSFEKQCNQLQSLTIKFTKLPEPSTVWQEGQYKAFHIIQCETPVLRIIKLKGLSLLISLSLVNVRLKQSHLKYLLKLPSQIERLDLSMNRQLGDYGFLMLIESEWVEKLKELSMGGPDSGCSLTNASLKLIVECADRLPNVCILDLSWNQFDDEGYRYLRRNFQQISSIPRINLTRTRIEYTEPQLPNILV